MNFKKLGLGLAATAAITTGIAFAEKPAEAASLAPGSFGLQAAEATVVGPNGNTPLLQFSLLDFSINNPLGALATLTEDVGGAQVKNLQLSAIAGGPSNDFSNAFTADFITGLKLGSSQLVFDLDASTAFLRTGVGANANFTSTLLTGTLRELGGSTVLGSATVSALRVGNGQTSIDVATVPTPALLPAALSMGVAALRKKRKQEADADLAPEPVEA